MRLSPPEPSFLDMRNAIVQADVAANGGANRDVLWSVFAARGMGYFAGTVDANDFDPVEDFATPPAPGGPTGTISGKLTDGTTGAPVVGQKVGVGGHATDPAFADALVASSGADGRYSLTVPVGTYRNVVIEGSGFNTEHLDDVVVTAGSTTTFDATLTRNWASPDSGATTESNDEAFAEIGCGSGQLVDGTGATGWSAYQSFAEPDPDFGLPPNPHENADPVATIKLAAPIDISEFLMDPGPACGDDPTSMTKRYRVETSQNGTDFVVAKEGTFHASAANTMNTVKPDANAADVQYVRLTLLESFKPFSSGQLFIDFSELTIIGAPRNTLPTGTLSATPAGVTPNQSVSLTASFTDADSAITGYDWDFDGNGTVDQSTGGPTTTTSYAAAGTYAPKVSVNDFRGGAGTASASVTVAVPQPPPPGGGDRPGMTLRRTGSNGRIAFGVTCDSACAGKATVTLTKRAARQLDLKRRAAGSRAITLLRPGTRQLRVRLSQRVRRAMRRAGVRRVRATLSVKVTDAERQTRTRKATVRIRR